MKKFSYKTKSIFSILIFSLPICVLAFLMFSSQNLNIQFAEKEIAGNDYQKPLQTLLRIGSMHRIYWSRVEKGDSQLKSTLASLYTEGDKALAQLKAQDELSGNLLEFTDSGLQSRKRAGMNFQSINSLWQKIKSNPTDEINTQFISNIRTMITHLGDTSNLILDPDLDSYYLMDISLLGLPQTQDRMQNIMVLMDHLFLKKEVTAADRMQISNMTAMLKESDWQRILASAQTALNEDARFYGTSPSLQTNLASHIKSYSSTTEKLISALEQINDLQKKWNVDEFRSVAEASLKESFSLSETSQTELSILVNKRVSSLKWDRNFNLAASLFVLVFASLFAWGLNNSIILSMHNVLTQLSKTGNQLNQSSETVNSTSSELSAMTSSSAASFQQSVASIEQISSMISVNTQNSKLVSELSLKAESTSQLGEECIIELGTCMQSITNVSKQIEKITSVINDISFQTNLLALNAAVEAARAGEAGKGFAVVADSVRSLSEKSAEAAKEISVLIKKNVEFIENGAHLTNESGMILGEIVKSIKEVSELNRGIAQASIEQLSGVKEVVAGLNVIDNSSKTNSGSSMELAMTSEVLLSESDELQKQIEFLSKILNGNTNTHSNSHHYNQAS